MEKVLVVLGSAQENERLSRAAFAARYLVANPGINRVVFCGYNGEAVAMEVCARAHGMPARVQVLLERASKHTRENALYSKNILEVNGLGGATVVIVTCRYHMPRAWMTFRSIFDRVECTVDGLPDMKDVRQFVRLELPKIRRYALQGHLYPFSLCAANVSDA